MAISESVYFMLSYHVKAKPTTHAMCLIASRRVDRLFDVERCARGYRRLFLCRMIATATATATDSCGFRWRRLT